MPEIEVIPRQKSVSSGANTNLADGILSALNDEWPCPIGAETQLLQTFANGYNNQSIILLDGQFDMSIIRGITFVEGTFTFNKILILRNVGTLPIILIANDLTNTKQERFILDFDVYIMPNCSFSIQLTEDGLLPLSSSDLSNMRYISSLHHEFYTVQDGDIAFNAALGGSNALLTGQDGHQYVFAHRSGISLGKACWIAGVPNFAGQNNGIVAGNKTYISFSALVKIPVLIDASDDFEWRFGFMDNGGISTAGPDGIYFKYSASSQSWACVCSTNGGETILYPLIDVNPKNWYYMQIRVSPVGDYVEFLIDGVRAGLIYSDIPVGTGHEFTVGSAFEKTAGVENRDVYMDYFRMDIVTKKR